MNTAIWLFGRGSSIACGLDWTVPDRWRHLPREHQIQRIIGELRAQMQRPSVATEPYRRLIQLLAKRTAPDWRHRLMTTNWDYLLQREVDQAFPEVCPRWLQDTHVSHLNGTCQPSRRPEVRSDFLLESDPRGMRRERVESNIAYTHLILAATLVVVGMSFECETDNSLLRALQASRMPVCHSDWFVINPDREAVDRVAGNIHAVLPRSKVFPVAATLSEWLDRELAELQAYGILAPRCQAVREVCTDAQIRNMDQTW